MRSCPRIVLLIAVLFSGHATYAQTDDVPKAVGSTDYNVYADRANVNLSYINDLADGKPNTSTVCTLGGNSTYKDAYGDETDTYHELLIDLRDDKGNGKKINEVLLTLKNKQGNFFNTYGPYKIVRNIDESTAYTENTQAPFIIKAYTDEGSADNSNLCHVKYYKADGTEVTVNLPIESYTDYGYTATIDYNADSTKVFVTTTNPANNNDGQFSGSTEYKFLTITYLGEAELEIGDLRVLTDVPTVTYEASVVSKIGDEPTTVSSAETNGQPVLLCVKQTEDFGMPVPSTLTFLKGKAESEGTRIIKRADATRQQQGIFYYEYIPLVGKNMTVSLADETAKGNSVTVTVNTLRALNISNPQIFDLQATGVVSVFNYSNLTKDYKGDENTGMEETSYNFKSSGSGLYTSGDVIIDLNAKYTLNAIRAVYSSIYYPVTIYATTYSGQSGETLTWQKIGAIKADQADGSTSGIVSCPNTQYLDLSNENLQDIRALKFSFVNNEQSQTLIHEISIFGSATETTVATTPMLTMQEPAPGNTLAVVKASATDAGSPWLNYKITWKENDYDTNKKNVYALSGTSIQEVLDNLYNSTTYKYTVTVTNSFGKTATQSGTFTTTSHAALTDLNQGEAYDVIHYLSGPYDATTFGTINDAITNAGKAAGALMYDLTDVTFSEGATGITLSNSYNPNTFFIVSGGGESQIASSQTNVITNSSGSYSYSHDVVITDGYDVYNGGMTVTANSNYENEYPTCRFTRTTSAPWGTVCLPFAVDRLKMKMVGDYENNKIYWANPQSMKGSNILRYWWPTTIKAVSSSEPDSIVFYSGVDKSTKLTEGTYGKNMQEWTDEDYENYISVRPQYIASNSGGILTDGRRVAIVQFLMDAKGSYTASDGIAYKTGDQMTATIQNERSYQSGLTLYFSDATSQGNEYQMEGGKQTCYLTGTLRKTTLPQGKYYLPAKADTDGKTAYDGMSLHRAAKDKTLNAFRAYITVPGYEQSAKPGASAKSLVIIFADREVDEQGQTTEIKRIATDEELSQLFNIYSINGQLVRRGSTSPLGLPSGIYIINGKKVIVR